MENQKKFKIFAVLGDSKTNVRFGTEVDCSNVDTSNLLNFAYDCISQVSNDFAENFDIKSFYVEFSD